jgi:hypothetical protein
MRSGGEADKLANSYEGLWTIHQLFDILDGEARSLIPEPLEDARGVEFHKILANGARESHSVKIQTPDTGWTLASLTRVRDDGRSYLGDLLEKTAAESNAQACFVSEVSANALRILCEEARRAADPATFHTYLEIAEARLRADFRDRVLPLCDDREDVAHDRLRRIYVSTFPRGDLVKIVNREIARSFYRHDGQSLDIDGVRRLLAEFILESLRKPVDRVAILGRLSREGIGETDWARDPTIQELLQARIDAFLQHATQQLINDALIPRPEAAAAFDEIRNGTHKFGLFIGIAGLGKTCATAELVQRLLAAGIPCLPLRMDVQTDELTAAGLGKKLQLPASPVDVLNGMADGQMSVLVLDQLDALSLASGKNQNLWEVFDDLLCEIRSCKNMKVWLACRAFELEHDYRLRGLLDEEKAHRIQIAPLDAERVKTEIVKANVDPSTLGSAQLEMLRTPMHLSLYLESAPAGKPPFQTVQELYDRYWDRKRDLVAERLGRAPHWNEVIDFACDRLSRGLTVPAEMLEDAFPEDVRFMTSANVIVKENGTYRFFHDGFYEYAFARRFVGQGRDLLRDLLLAGKQELFVRGPVRQVLAYLRTKHRRAYLDVLTRILRERRVRGHIQKLVLDWMRTLVDPSPEEFEILGFNVT